VGGVFFRLKWRMSSKIPSLTDTIFDATSSDDRRLDRQSGDRL
jgi:hypothetical protein